MPRLIKIAGIHLIKPLSLIYNRSIELGQVTCQWKMSNISAILIHQTTDQYLLQAVWVKY